MATFEESGWLLTANLASACIIFKREKAKKPQIVTFIYWTIRPHERVLSFPHQARTRKYAAITLGPQR